MKTEVRRESMMNKIIQSQAENISQGVFTVEVIMKESATNEMGEISMKMLLTSDYSIEKILKLPFVDFSIGIDKELRPIVIKNDYENWRKNEN